VVRTVVLKNKCTSLSIARPPCFCYEKLVKLLFFAGGGLMAKITHTMEKVLFKNKEEECSLQFFGRTFACDSGLSALADFTKRIQELSITFRNNTLANVLRKTSFTIEDLVFPDDFKDLLAMMMFKHADASIESFKILKEKTSLEYNNPIIRKNDGFSLFGLDDKGMLIEHYQANSEFRRAGGSGGETVWYRSYLWKITERFPLEKKKSFQGKFILLK
jgi:hypothetical protein